MGFNRAKWISESICDFIFGQEDLCLVSCMQWHCSFHLQPHNSYLSLFFSLTIFPVPFFPWLPLSHEFHQSDLFSLVPKYSAGLNKSHELSGTSQQEALMSFEGCVNGRSVPMLISSLHGPSRSTLRPSSVVIRPLFFYLFCSFCLISSPNVPNAPYTYTVCTCHCSSISRALH